MDTSHTSPDQPDLLPVFVPATTADSTPHALALGRALSSARHAPLDIITAPEERLTVSSARVHGCALPIDDWDPHPFASPTFVRTLAATEAPEAHVTVGPSMESCDIPALVPSHATIGLAGPVRHFVESREQRLGRRLAHAGDDVVFLPL